jgi:hypothetical protein
VPLKIRAAMKLPVTVVRASFFLAAVLAFSPVFVSAQDADDPASQNRPGSDLERADKTPLDDLIAVTQTRPLTIPKTSTTSGEFYRRLGMWANARWRAPLARELEELKVEEPEKNAEYLWNWFCNGPAGGKVGSFTERMRKTVPENAQAPIAQFIVGNMALETRAWSESRKRLRLSVEHTTGDRGAPLIAALASARLNGDKSRPQDPKVQEQTLKFLAEAFGEGKFAEEDGPFLTHIICSRLAGLAHTHLGERLIPLWEKAALPEWVRQYAIGKAHVAVAWRHRGGDWADAVSEKGWEGFGKHLAPASAAFRKSWQLHPGRPEAAMEMISIAMAGHASDDESTRLWFDRAIAAECDHRFAYQKMINSLTPRWGGSYDRLLAFGVACARTERYDTDVPGKLLTVLGELGDELPDYRPVLHQADIANLLLKFRRAQLDSSKKSGDPARIRSSEAYLAITAMLVGDRKTAVSTLQAMHPDGKPLTMPVPAGEWATSWNLDWSAEYFEGMLEGSAAAATWERAKEAREEHFFDSALKKVAEVETKSPAAADWLAGWRSLVQFERDFAKGEWTRFPHDFVTWHRGYGHWERPGKEQFSVRRTIDQSHGLFSRARLGEHFELRGKVRLETASQDRRFSFGVLFGHELSRKQRAQREHVVMFTTADREHFRSEIGLRRALREMHKDGAKVKLAETNTFRLERRGTRVSAWVNGEQALKDAELPDELASGEGAIGLIAYPYVAQEPIQFSELEARRL